MTGDSAAPVFTLTPGPAGATPATRAALSQPILHHRDLVFLALCAETVESLAARCVARARRRTSAPPSRRHVASSPCE
jgi:aspartate aminotransferase-like enzyme